MHAYIYIIERERESTKGKEREREVNKLIVHRLMLIADRHTSEKSHSLIRTALHTLCRLWGMLFDTLAFEGGGGGGGLYIRRRLLLGMATLYGSLTMSCS